MAFSSLGIKSGKQRNNFYKKTNNFFPSRNRYNYPIMPINIMGYHININDVRGLGYNSFPFKPKIKESNEKNKDNTIFLD